MEHLIKHYSFFSDESLHLEKIFPNSLFCFHHENNLAHQYFYPVSPEIVKNQQKHPFCWFFFASTSIKNIT
jgi:hypothetical protein